MKRLGLVLAMSMLSGCNPAMDEWQPRDFSFAGLSVAVEAPGTIESAAPQRSEKCRPAAEDRLD